MLVCGISGFLGRNIAEHFSDNEGYAVTGTYFNSRNPQIENVDSVRGDLRDHSFVEEIVRGQDIIVQMASVTTGSRDVIERPYLHVTDNSVMNPLLLRAAYDQNVGHFIFPSCTTMYPSSDEALKEEDFNPDTIDNRYFGVANMKVAIEKQCEFFSSLGRTKHTVLRHSNIYGPHDKFDLERSHVFGATMTKVINAAEELEVWGTGEEKRDLLYVSDIVDFVDRAIEYQESAFGLYNVGIGEGISINDLVQKIIRESGKELKITHDTSKPTIPVNIFLDSSKARRELGWEPQVTLEEGIAKTMEWYHKNI